MTAPAKDSSEWVSEFEEIINTFNTLNFLDYKESMKSFISRVSQESKRQEREHVMEEALLAALVLGEMSQNKNCKCGGKYYYTKTIVNGSYPNLEYVYEYQCKKCYNIEQEKGHKEVMCESHRLSAVAKEERLTRSRWYLEEEGYMVLKRNRFIQWLSNLINK